MKRKHTEVDFENLSWHDCHIWGIEFCVGDPAEQDWTSDLMLDIDFIAQWVPDTGGQFQFRVAPAILVFHGITDPRIDINWGSSGFQSSLYIASIDAIRRERVQEQKVYLDRPYYKWQIVLNGPQNSAISFGAFGFTQILLAEPVQAQQQHLSRSERARLKSENLPATKI